jgi:hypothetical protein
VLLHVVTPAASGLSRGPTKTWLSPPKPEEPPNFDRRVSAKGVVRRERCLFNGRSPNCPYPTHNPGRSGADAAGLSRSPKSKVGKGPTNYVAPVGDGALFSSMKD